MSIEQKIAEILAESKIKSLKEDKEAEIVAEEETLETTEEIAEESTLEEAEMKDPSDGSQENPDNKKNNVDKQEVGGKAKASNVVTKGASAPEASHIAGIKEDVEALINGEELTEEFKQKAATIFEAAVLTRVKQEVARLDEVYEQRLEEQVETIVEGLVEKVDGYLDYVVEQWMEQNEIALESGMKSEILEGFVHGMKNLFAEHYIDVPEEKLDVLEALEEQVQETSQLLDEQMATNVQLKRELAAYQIVQKVQELSEGLTDTDREKFHTLIEEITFEDIESFQKKAQTIRENYFTNKATTRKSVVETIVTDSPVVLSEESTVPQNMRNYVSMLNNLK